MIDTSSLVGGKKKKKLAIDSTAAVEGVKESPERPPESSEKDSDKPESQRQGEKWERLNKAIREFDRKHQKRVCF